MVDRPVDPLGTAGDKHEAGIRTTTMGGLSTLEGNTLWLVVHGTPVTQGSMSAVATGVVRHHNSAKLKAWRDQITTEALREYGSSFTQITCPVQLDVVFTVPRPKTLRDTKGVVGAFVPPATKPDIDKLTRAVQDALSPREVKGQRRFKLLDEDSRIIGGSHYKTYPRPGHVHPWALNRPGVVIRLSPVGTSQPAPGLVLGEAGELPDKALNLAVKAQRRVG